MKFHTFFSGARPFGAVDPCNFADPRSLARLGQSETPPMVAVNATHLACALELLRQYRDYSEEMRKIGRGFEPCAGGFSPDGTRLALETALETAQAAHDRAPDTKCPACRWHDGHGAECALAYAEGGAA